MNDRLPMSAAPEPPAWAVALAFGVVYVAWGTTYLATKEGVKVVPPALFSGVRLALAGVILLAGLAGLGNPVRVPWGDLPGMALGAAIMFVCGNWLITVAQKTIDSGVASVLVATTPLWMAVLGMLWPDGDRLSGRGCLGLVAGPAGVCLLLAPKLHNPSALGGDLSPFMVLGSAFSWALGSLLLRHRRLKVPPVVAAAYQMMLGGAGLTLVGLATGEAGQLTPEVFRPNIVFCFVYLLVVGSLTGFVAYSWLLGHVSAASVGTYAYVNPLVAILVGWLLGGEEVTLWLVVGMAVILTGVALVRSGAKRLRT